MSEKEGAQPPVLDEEQSAKLLGEMEKHMSCLVCPYFQAYDVDVQFGMVGKCKALEHLAAHKAQKGILGKAQAFLMRTLSKGLWTMIVEDCPYYKRAKKLEEKGEVIL